MSINSGLQFSLPNLPPSADPAISLLLQPLYTSMYSLFAQVSAQLGQTINDPALWPTITPDKSLQINGQRKLYLLNSTGSTIVAGKFVYIKTDGSIALSGTDSATAPIGFVTKDCFTGATAELIVGEGLLTGSALTTGTKYQAGASGALAVYTGAYTLTADLGTGVVTGTMPLPVLAIAISSTFIYVRIPIY